MAALTPIGEQALVEEFAIPRTPKHEAIGARE